MRQVGSDYLLSHTYRWNPPLLRLLETPRPCQFRESWEFQWTLAHSSCFGQSKGANSWRIINRLTGWHLSPRFSIANSQTLKGHGGDWDWQLELDSAGNWTIKNLATLCFLAPGGSGRGGLAVVCDSGVVNDLDKNWRLWYVGTVVPLIWYRIVSC